MSSNSKLAPELVATIRETFKTPLNYRPVHAKGQLCLGTFTPTAEAANDFKAPIFSTASTPLIMRYSTDTEFEDLPDNGENASRGFAIRFQGEGDIHYDIITNNAFGFIVGTGEGFLEQFKALQDDKFNEFLDKNAHAKYFADNQSPAHAYSFANEQWYSTQAFKFVNAVGKERAFRWRIVPWQGVLRYSKDDAAKRSKHFQFEDLEHRLNKNKPIKYHLLAQLAEPGNPTNDSTKIWPGTNEFVEFGTILVEKLYKFPEGREQEKLNYNPVPKYIEGIDVSDDPLLQVRDLVYELSGKISREHASEPVQQAVQ